MIHNTSIPKVLMIMPVAYWWPYISAIMVKAVMRKTLVATAMGIEDKNTIARLTLDKLLK